MKILVICSENYSAGNSPLAMAVSGIVYGYRQQGAQVLGFSPFFNQFTDEKDYEPSQKFTEKLGNREYRVLKKLPNENDLLIRYDDYFGRAGIYSNPNERAYDDNHLRFSFLASAALNYCAETNFKPDAIHVHDWSGIAGALTKTVYKGYFENTPVLLTVHSIRYDCQFDPSDIYKIGLPAEGFDIDGYEFWGKVSMLKVAILYSDKVVLTSASYLFFLLAADLPGGMRDFLESQRKKLFSIQSGIDRKKWYAHKEENFKQQKKDALRAELHLAADSSMLVYTQLDSYSGNPAQVISTIMANLLNMNLQLIIGIPENDDNYPYFVTIQEEHSDKIALLPLNKNDDDFYNRLVASDVFLSINTNEPSLSLFLKAAAAGSIPLYNKRSQRPFIYTISFDPSSEELAGKTNAFVSEDGSPELILEQIRYAESIFHENKTLWGKIVENARSTEVSWEDAAKNYLLLLNTPGL
ncbi:MAG: glycogen/starch synthase [Fibromonadales bacterium]|nr:glycogen/starch synthase [Fibromonadales bacterium]